MKKYYILGASLLLIIALTFSLVGCTGSPAPTQPAQVTPNLSDRLQAAESQVKTLSLGQTNLDTRLSAVEKEQKDSPSSKEVQSAISQATTASSGVAGIQGAISQLQNDVNTLKNKPTPTPTIDTSKYDNQVKDLQNQINNIINGTTKITLPTPTPTTDGSGTTNDGTLVVTIRDLGTEILSGGFNFSGGDSIKLTLTNKGTTDITDLRLYIYLQPEPSMSPSFIDMVNGNISLGGDIACTLISSSPDEYKFKTSRITLAAGKTKNYYLTPNVLIKPRYQYRDKYTNIETNSATTPTIPVDGTVQNNPLNTTPTISKITEDVEFTPLYEVIDYNK